MNTDSLIFQLQHLERQARELLQEDDIEKVTNIIAQRHQLIVELVAFEQNFTNVQRQKLEESLALGDELLSTTKDKLEKIQEELLSNKTRSRAILRYQR